MRKVNKAEQGTVPKELAHVGSDSEKAGLHKMMNSNQTGDVICTLDLSQLTNGSPLGMQFAGNAMLLVGCSKGTVAWESAAVRHQGSRPRWMVVQRLERRMAL